ncbi:hypothetical protein KSS87_000332 [Heliosperma pusillum]|nr:hypothetical protein KSS87_000332 [Heliosperma pusillum]
MGDERWTLLCIMLVILFTMQPSLATVYTVGDASGWTLGVDYGTWSSSNSFLVGDSLVFDYGSGHTVDEVKPSDYKTCTIGNPITTDNKGSSTILLQTPGTHFFICGVIGHCSTGMKLSVNVLASAGTDSPSTTGTTPSTDAPSTTGTTPSTAGLAPTTFPTTATPVMIPDYSVVSKGSVVSLGLGPLGVCGVVGVTFLAYLV